MLYVFNAQHDTPAGNNMPPDPHLVNENTFPETIDLFFNRPSNIYSLPTPENMDIYWMRILCFDKNQNNNNYGLKLHTRF